MRAAQSNQPTQRFTDRVRDYARWRPGYPPGLVGVIREETGLESGAVIADIGSGTGLSAAPFLDRGYRVHGVEPNLEMRGAQEALLAGREGFRSVAGRAEDTGLPEASVGLVLVAQAFHWLDPTASRREFLRILRPAGWVALVWNTRRTTSTAFLREYEALLIRHGTDYARVRHDSLPRSRLDEFFGGGYAERSLYNEQLLDRQGLRGRILSCSYVPAAGQPGRADVEREIERLFREHRRAGQVRIEYDTEVFVGRLA